MQHTKIQIGDKSLLPEIEKRVLLPEVDGQVGQVLAKGPDGTTVWTEGGGLPSGAKDGDLLIKSAEIVGNDYNDDHTVLFIQGNTSNAAAADSPIPVTWNNQPAIQEDNTLLLTGSTQLSTASAPEVKRVFGGEFTVEAYLKPTQFNNTSRQDTNFFYLNGPSTYYIYLSNYNNSGNAQNGKFGLWAYADNRQITLNNNEFHHVALDVYMDGSARKYTIYYDGVAVQTGNWYNDGVADSTNAIIRFFSSSDSAELNNCYLKSIRVSDIARYKGKSFTPPANGLYLPAPDGEWVTINKSQLVAQDDVKLNPDPVKVPAGKYGFSPALRNVDLVNGDTTKLYINPNLSGKEIKDIASGTSTPHTFVNHNVTVSESTGAMVFDGSSSYLEIDPSDIITEGQEWCLDLYLKTTRYDSKIMNIRTWTDSGQEFSIWIRSSGEISVHSSPLGTGVVGKAIPLNEEFRFTLEQYIENSVWKLAMYVNGEHFGTVDAELHRYHSNTVLGKGYNDPWMSGEISRVIWRTEAPYKGTNFTDEAATKLSYVMPNKVNDVPAGSTVQLNNNGTPVYVEAEKVLLNDAKNVKLNQLDPTRQLPATTTNSVTPVYKKQDVIGAMYNDSKVVVLLQGSKTNTAKNAAFQLTGGDEVTVDSDGNLVFNRGNGIIVPSGKFNNEANGQFTVDIMLAVDQLPSGSGNYEYIFGNDNSPTYPFNYRVFGDGTVRFQYQNTNHNIQIEKGIFALLSFDYDGTTLRSYKDGVLVGAQDITYSAFPNTIGIGTDQYYQHTGFAGRIKYIRMSNIARYRGQAFTPPGLAGYITPPDGEWTTAPAIGDDRLLPENPSDGDLAVYGIVPEAAAPSGLISFTSDPNWVVSHSGSYSGRDGWQAFDDDRSSAWCTYEAKIGDWLQWEYKGEAGKVLLRRYQIAKAWGNGDCPTSWKIQGSNDGAKWVDLDERSGQSFPNNDYNEYTIPGNKTPYKFHRFYLLDWNTSNMIGDFKAWSWIDSVDECEGWFLLNQSSLGVDLSNYTGGTISLNATEALNLSSAKSMVISTGEMNQSLSLAARTVYIGTPDPNVVSGKDARAAEPFYIYLEGHPQNNPGGLVVLGSDGKLPAIDGSKLTNLPAATVDLSNYSAENIKLTGTTKIELNAGTGTALQIATESGDAFRTTFKTSGLWSADIAGYLTTIHGGMQMDIYADSSQADVRIYAGGSPSSSSGDGNILLYGSDIKFNGNALNSANGLVKAEAGKLPALDGSKLTNLPGGSVDLSSYTGKINLTSANDQTVSIKFNSGNPTYNAEFTMDTTGIDLIGYGTITVGYRNGGYVQFTSGMTTLFSMSSLAINAGSRITLSATEGIYLGAAGMNTAGGLAKINTDGKLPASIIPDVSTAAPKRAYIPIPKGDNGVTITEMFVELKFTDTKNFESGAVDVNMTNAAAAMFGVTSVAKDNGSVVPSLVQMTEAGVPVEFFETYLLLDIDYLGSAGLNLLDDSKTYIAAYRWRATLEDDTTNTPWRLLSF
jgi:hypothetical protein